MVKKRPIAVDLFAGAGGMTLGFEQAGFDILASVEIDPIHCAIHKFNFPFWTVLCKSVEDITGKEIRNSSQIHNQEIDVVFGGPPCQGFSLMGKRSFDDPRNSLVFHFIRLVLELQPKFFVIENVKGMTVGKHKEFIGEIIDKFENNGYKVNHTYQVLNAANYGVPQNRERLFLLGCRQDLELPNYPEKITFSNQKSPTVWEALQDLPAIESYPELSQQDWVFAEFGQPSNYAKKLRNLTIEKNNYSYQRQYDHKLLTSSLRTNHSPESMERFASTPHGKIEKISRFHKLDPDGLCNTLRAGTPSNKGAFTSPRPIHPFIPRCITVREAARLHSYPDWFRFHPTKWHGFRQIGNSVPPLLAQAVAEEIIKSLGIEPSQTKCVKELGDISLLTLDMSEAAKYFGVSRHVIEPRTRKK
ncbi:DNA cytosine methyltransferase [Dolichospermum sp. ST_con]|nr:DNA cytosine methyltransferase [Dolichospermum sp. ST_con]MDD1422015.1 DNA cytosine methyltransferase [Dolichospermum sp. ST_sed1]MDD1427526.1 DNA cytosine methyltransferase [Dolichospermum sp. ST_sed9]MDD1434044.1 DNA cytosine methyltransferase [Dolichospermum sp. ST_sed6]MDD1437718.1 DNA cytosine methyltransferase [Dolichospermum sp. ST_sed10]MDD1443375.1 DNA cytosine methyltransferase [Dolichospermum sp. ST_sed3]MDD1447673.1 DNA cytosine methyltransferase [Dolichospermum sp. ST_sed8]MD